MPLLSNRKHRLRHAVAAALVALSPLAAAAAADEGPAAPIVSERRFADWTLRCEDTTCWIYDNAPREEGQRVPYAMTIGARAQDGAYRMLVHMAKASRLMRRQGIDLYVDGQKAGHLAYARCGDPDCIFLADYSRAAIEAIVAAEALVLWAPDPHLLPGAATEISTVGLKEAFDAFRASALPGLLPR
jgi:invasion protein IalB